MDSFINGQRRQALVSTMDRSAHGHGNSPFSTRTVLSLPTGGSSRSAPWRDMFSSRGWTRDQDHEQLYPSLKEGSLIKTTPALHHSVAVVESSRCRHVTSHVTHHGQVAVRSRTVHFADKLQGNIFGHLWNIFQTTSLESEPAGDGGSPPMSGRSVLSYSLSRLLRIRVASSWCVLGTNI